MNQPRDQKDPTGRLVAMLAEVLQDTVQRGATKEELLPALADLVADTAFIIDGLDGVNSVIRHIAKRFDDWVREQVANDHKRRLI